MRRRKLSTRKMSFQLLAHFFFREMGLKVESKVLQRLLQASRINSNSNVETFQSRLRPRAVATVWLV